MKSRILAVLAVAMGTLLVPGATASAVAADFTPAPGTYAVDTGALTLTGPATGIGGVDQGGIAVFSFDNVNIPAGVTINVQGSRPFKLVASGSLTMAGTINGNGANVADFSPAGGAGGPGGGAGGSGGATSSAGVGVGGGDNSSSSENGGGGGGFGGAGAPGGVKTGVPDPALGGVSYGDLNAVLQGGSGGASGSTFTGGGGGGGAIALVGSTVTISGIVFADGGSGAVGAGGSGGGSGGGILVHGNTVEVTGFLVARGGDGGEGGCCGDGGAGGGGRIAYQFRTLIASGTALVNGGASGVRTTGPCGCGTGFPSTKANGDMGVVIKTEAPKATTGPATAVTAASATLNGTVNPSLHPTSYYFEYGTTGAYGSRVPAGPAFAGSDGGDHVVSQVLSGLAPNTTYHYRVVAVDGTGFVIPGTDIGFTTSAAPPAAAKPKSSARKKCKKTQKKNKKGKCVKKKHKKHGKHKKH